MLRIWSKWLIWEPNIHKSMSIVLTLKLHVYVASTSRRQQHRHHRDACECISQFSHPTAWRCTVPHDYSHPCSMNFVHQLNYMCRVSLIIYLWLEKIKNSLFVCCDNNITKYRLFEKNSSVCLCKLSSFFCEDFTAALKFLRFFFLSSVLSRYENFLVVFFLIMALLNNVLFFIYLYSRTHYQLIIIGWISLFMPPQCSKQRREKERENFSYDDKRR